MKGEPGYFLYQTPLKHRGGHSPSTSYDASNGVYLNVVMVKPDFTNTTAREAGKKLEEKDPYP